LAKCSFSITFFEKENIPLDMPVNRNALIRYRTIDNCLKNRYRKWTLEDLIDACSDALYEYEGIDKGVSRRTVQGDIQMMRSDKLGYNAPIIVVERKFYTYEDPNYSITNIPLTGQDLDRLTEVVAILKQFKGFSHFQEVSGMVQKLEDKINTSKNDQLRIIDFEKNDDLRGLEYLDEIYQAILRKQSINITYQSFKARQANLFIFHPYLLKEYRNRWFLLGMRDKGQRLMTLALDRIQQLAIGETPYHENRKYDMQNYFKDVVGVTVNENQRPEHIELFIDNRNAPYVITKPIHPSQQLIRKEKNGIVIHLKLQINFEWERVVLGFGPSMQVLAPRKLKLSIQILVNESLNKYL
jgi:predicted DNA-binding transcriptional regulator YafY